MVRQHKSVEIAQEFIPGGSGDDKIIPSQYQFEKGVTNISTPQIQEGLVESDWGGSDVERWCEVSVKVNKDGKVTNESIVKSSTPYEPCITVNSSVSSSPLLSSRKKRKRIIEESIEDEDPKPKMTKNESDYQDTNCTTLTQEETIDGIIDTSIDA